MAKYPLDPRARIILVEVRLKGKKKWEDGDGSIFSFSAPFELWLSSFTLLAIVIITENTMKPAPNRPSKTSRPDTLPAPMSARAGVLASKKIPTINGKIDGA